MVSIERSEFIELESKRRTVPSFVPHKLCPLLLAWSIGLSTGGSVGCVATQKEERTQVEKPVVLGDAAMLSSFDYSTALVTHGVAFAVDGIEPKTLAAAQRAGRFACEKAQKGDETFGKQANEAMDSEMIRALQQQGADPHVGLEIARVVAGCYAALQGNKTANAHAKALFLSIASHCFSQQEASSDALNRLMLALFDSQEMPLATYVDTLFAAKSEAVFSKHFMLGNRMCAHLTEAHSDTPETSQLELENLEVDTEPQRVYVGILRGQAPGRVRLVVRDRVIGGEVTIGSKKLTVQGKIGRFNTLHVTGGLGTESIELRGKLKDRARKIRGRYDGKIRRRNQPRRSRLIGFWEATLDEESSN